MNFDINEEQQEFVSEVLKFSKTHLVPKSFDVPFQREMWDAISDFGLFALTIGEEYEGLGESYLTAALAYEALGYGCEDNGFIFAITNHVWVALNMISLYGNKKLKEKYMSQMIAGKQIGAFALSEAESGSDALNMSMTATKKEDHYILRGNKMFISNGSAADVFLVIAKMEGISPNKYTCFVVDRTMKGVTTGPDIKKMGLTSCPMAELILQDCEVPKENILGMPGMGYGLMLSALEWERIYEFAPHVGAMKRIMERCIEHATKRRQFGKAIGEFDSIAHKIADMRTSIEIAKLMLYKVAWMKDNGQSAFLEASMFKLYVSEHYVKLCQNALQIFGAYGYTEEYGIERELRDALGCTIYSGTTEIQKNTIYKLSI